MAMGVREIIRGAMFSVRKRMRLRQRERETSVAEEIGRAHV